MNSTQAPRTLPHAAGGFGSIALAGMLCTTPRPRHDPLGRRSPGPVGRPHFPARARRVIFLYMTGGVSHVDTFDPKPKLFADHGKTITVDNWQGKRGQFKRYLKRPQWTFRPRRPVRASRSAICSRTCATSSTTSASSARWRRTTRITTRARSACTPARSRSPGRASGPGSATAWARRTGTCRRSSRSRRRRPMPARRPGGPTSCRAAIRDRKSFPADADRRTCGVASPRPDCSSSSSICSPRQPPTIARRGRTTRP